MLRLRSCASSMMIVSYWRSIRSCWISASRMPSVISLTKVSSLDLVGEAHLLADGLAERRCPAPPRCARRPCGRRSGAAGCARSCPRTPRPSSRQIFGSCVVLPEPVSPATITTWWSRITSAMSSLRLADRQLLRVRQLGNRLPTAPNPLLGLVDVGGDARQDVGSRLSAGLAEPVQPTAHPVRVTHHEPGQAGTQLVDGRRRTGGRHTTSSLTGAATRPGHLFSGTASRGPNTCPRSHADCVRSP